MQICLHIWAIQDRDGPLVSFIIILAMMSLADILFNGMEPFETKKKTKKKKKKKTKKKKKKNVNIPLTEGPMWNLVKSGQG